MTAPAWSSSVSGAVYIKLAKNPDYWGGAPYLEFLVFRVIPDEATRVLALESGEADVLFETPPSAIKTLRGNPKIKVARVPTYRDVNVHFKAQFFLGINMPPPTTRSSGRTGAGGRASTGFAGRSWSSSRPRATGASGWRWRTRSSRSPGSRKTCSSW